jgi:uncharacterized protein YcbX
MPPTVASLVSIFRYPVKSMLGERLEATALGANGLPGDRAWALRDEARGGIEGGKKIPALMSCSARYTQPVGVGDAQAPATAPAPEITLASGEVVSASDPEAARKIGQAVGRELTLWPLLPADALDHYRRGKPDNDDLLDELRATFARLPDEPLPDIGKFPPELLEFGSPVGTYFDAFPLMIMSRQSLDTLAAAAPESQIDVRRFRPNLLVDIDVDAAAAAAAADSESDSAQGGFPEQDWIGRKLRIGSATLQIAMECPRCVMTTHGFADIPKDPTIMRTLVKEAGGNLGVYASVETPGEISTGDAIEVVD